MPAPVPAPDRAVVREASTSDEPLSVDRLLGLVSHPRVGGIGLFVGVVRDHDHGSAVTSLDYTCHPGADFNCSGLPRSKTCLCPAAAGSVSQACGAPLATISVSTR